MKSVDVSTVSLARQIDAVGDRFESAWKTGRPPRIDDFLPTADDRAPQGARAKLLRELVWLDLEFRWELGERPRLEDYLRLYPELGPRDAIPLELIAHEFELHNRCGDRPCREEYAARFGQRGMQAVARFDTDPLEQQADASAVAASAPSTSREPQVLTTPPGMPPRLGRYVVTSLIGEGGFGVVYRGYDAELARNVAIKVPRPQRVLSAADVEAYLAEARMVAAVDHPAIVPVYDVGRTDDGLCYVVSKFVEGRSLAAALRQRRPTPRQAAELAACVAEALDHTHQRGIVHRDVKPSNILLAKREPASAGTESPDVADDFDAPVRLVDFGMALSDELSASGPALCGTPAYMSPEQARGEGHRVDARSDVYSLGVVLYEMLTGDRPYGTSDVGELLDAIMAGQIEPPRQRCEDLPVELDRICLRALSRRVSERYTTAGEMAQELREFLSHRLRRASFRGGCGPTRPATPTFSCGCFPDRPTQGACRSRSDSGNRESSKSPARMRSKWGCYMGRRVAASRRW